MINLNTYIIEKLRINSDTKLVKDADDYLFVIAYGDAFDYLKNKYEDVMVNSTSGDPIGFVLHRYDALYEYEHCKDHFTDDIAIYIVPKGDIDDFVDSYRDGEVTLEDLKALKKFKER